MSSPLKTGLNNPKIKEAFNQQVIQTLEWAPAAADDDYFKTSTNLAAQTTTLASGDMTKSYVIDIPVQPVLVITNDKASGETSWTSVAATMTGIDQFGNAVSETIAATDSNDTWTATFLNAYAKLTELSFTVTGGTECDSSDSYVLGYAKTYGLCCVIGSSSDVLIHNFNLANDAGTVNTQYCTYTFAGTPDGSKLARLYIRSTAL